MSRIYVAGASREARMVAGFIRQLRAAGHSITFDWTETVIGSTVPERDLSDLDRFDRATTDARAVHEAEIVWLVVPESESIGSWVEFGIAFGIAMQAEDKIIAASGDLKRSIFTSLAHWQFDSHAVALGHLMGRK